MVDGIIPTELTESVRYDSSLNSFRESNSFDVIAFYGFTIDDFDVGIIATTATIKDGLRIVFDLTK